MHPVFIRRSGLIITQLYLNPEAGAQFPQFPASAKDQRSLDVDLGQVNLIIASEGYSWISNTLLTRSSSLVYTK